MTATRTDDDWMGAALSLARRGLGQTWPNPSVGCVIVKENRVVGRGHTQHRGRPHAEVVALAQAGAQARGATAYVTLEPCSHHGKSPPCTDALIKAGISRVVCAQTDPDPRVDGIKALRNAGIEITTGICAAEASLVHEGFTTKITKKRPFICLKIATTLDGKIATSSGESRWITGPDARRKVHMLRSSFDGIMIGRGTAQTDDPMLDVRDLGELNSPVRIVLDSQLRTSPDAKLVKTSGQIPTWIIHKKGFTNIVLTDAGCKLIEAQSLSQAMTRLADQGLTRVFCEGGATLASSLVKNGLVDELVVFQAGKLIGSDGIGAIGALDLDGLSGAPRFRLISQSQVGADLMSVWRP